MTPPITGIVGWIAARKTRHVDEITHHNEALKRLQETVDDLLTKNLELTNEIVKLRAENLEQTTQLIRDNEKLCSDVAELRRENALLKREIEKFINNK